MPKSISGNRRPRAGEAFLELCPDHPLVKVSQNPAFRRYVEAVAKAGQEILSKGKKEADAEWQVIAAEFKAEGEQFEREWEEAFGEPYPQTVQDYERWAARVGMPAAWIMGGRWTYGDLLPIIEGHLLKRRDAAAVAQPIAKQEEIPPAILPVADDMAWWSPRDLADKHSLPREALRKRLQRWRRNHADGWMEVSRSERKAHDPKFLYQPPAVQVIIDRMTD